MNKQEMLRKAYINAVENMIVAGLDNDTCYKVIRESMKLYLMGHNVEYSNFSKRIKYFYIFEKFYR